MESKELHLGLVQKKVVALEDRLQAYSHREADWEITTNKARKIEKQLERLQSRASLQRETITKLKAENSEAEALRVCMYKAVSPDSSLCSALKAKCWSGDEAIYIIVSEIMGAINVCARVCRDGVVKWKRD